MKVYLVFRLAPTARIIDLQDLAICARLVCRYKSDGSITFIVAIGHYHVLCTSISDIHFCKDSGAVILFRNEQLKY